jgi:hypothetical protein
MKKLLIFLILINASPVKSSYEEAKAKVLYEKALRAGCPKLVVKDAKKASALSLLPGGGSFYTGAPGMGVLGILFWPWSVAWEIPSSAIRSQTRNQIATVINCEEEGKI